ncbi:CD1375 family protein [Parablautia muri]
MSTVYAALIIKGKKTFDEVPASLKEQVKKILIDLECSDLLTK